MNKCVEKCLFTGRGVTFICKSNNILLTALFYSIIENRHLKIHKIEGLAWIHFYKIRLTEGQIRSYLLLSLNHFSKSKLSLRFAKTLPDKPLVHGRRFVSESDSRKVLVIPSSKKWPSSITWHSQQKFITRREFHLRIKSKVWLEWIVRFKGTLH